MARASRKSQPSPRVAEVMTKDPITLPSTATVREAATRMRDAGVGALVVTEGDAMLGLVTDRDIVVRCVAEGEDCQRTPLADICSREEIASVTPEDDVDRAIALMRERAVRRLPVIDQQKAVGILSIGDLALKRDPRSVLADISHASANR